MTTRDIAAEFGKIWAKIVGVLAVGIGSLYGIAYLLYTNQVVTHEMIASTNDLFFMFVMPVALLAYLVTLMVSISWSQAKWHLEKKERGW